MSRTGSTTRDRTREARRGSSPSGRSGVTRIRPRRRLNRRQRLLLTVGSAVVVAAIAAWVVLASPLLAVRTVQVDGASSLSVDQVRQAAGIAVGTPLVLVDLAAAEAAVRRLPPVADAQISRGWPDRVVVTLRERVAVAVVDTDGTRSLVDATGTSFDTITGDPPPGVVPVQVADPGPDDTATRAALAALVSLPPAVRDQLISVAATTGDDVTLTLAEGTSVLWGSAAHADRKAEVLGAVLEQVAAGTMEPAAQIDVSAPEAVVLR